MKGKNVKKNLTMLVGLSLLLVIAACGPRTRTVPGAEPEFYRASKDAVFSAVVQAISTSPGLNNSSGWIITQSDSAGGFVRAETTVGRDVEALSVVVSANTEGRSQVVIQGTARAANLAQRVRAQLKERFGSE